jgi:hypothetical protein
MSLYLDKILSVQPTFLFVLARLQDLLLVTILNASLTTPGGLPEARQTAGTNTQPPNHTIYKNEPPKAHTAHSVFRTTTNQHMTTTMLTNRSLGS